MMIPEEIVRFLEDATVGVAATRDEALVPALHHVESWSVGEDRKTITCLFASHYNDKLIPSLEDNSRFSFTALGSTSGPQRSQPPNPGVDFHECYQFKGDFVASRPANEADHDLVNRTAEKFKVLFQPLFGFSDRGCASRFAKPVLAVTFEVSEIYNQTPGPGAGANIGAEKRT